MFRDRQDAGKQLAERLAALVEPNVVVLALPRGGVAVAFEIAQKLHAPLDLVIVRKIGAPFQEELAIGAIADGDNPELLTDPYLIKALHVTPDYLQEAKTLALQEISRRKRVYLGDHEPVTLDGRTAIVVDDGIATGSTMLAALRDVRRRHPKRIILAVPVAPSQTLARLRKEVDEVVCLQTPSNFLAIGEFYRSFPQLKDAEVIALLTLARAAIGTPQ